MENEPQNIVTNTKIIKIIACGVLLAGVSVFFAAQNVLAQDSQSCQSEYDSSRETCRSTVFGCYDTCDRYDAGYYACQDACTAGNRDCIEAINNQYTACVEGTSEQPPTTQPVPPESTSNGTLYVPALVDTVPKDDDLPDYNEEPSVEEDKFYVIGTPYGPFAGRDLESRGIRVDYGIAFTQIKGGNPEIILPDGSKLDYTYKSFADLQQIPLGAKIVTPPGAEIKIKFIMSRLPESEKNPLFSPATSPNPKLRPGDRKLSIQMGENSQITFDQMYRGFAKIVVNKGDVRFKHGLIQFQAASETGVAPITKGTDYGVAYYPESKQTVIEIYDGGIDIVDLNTKKILATLSTSYGAQIKSIEVAEDKTIVEKIAIPRSEWDAFAAKAEKGGLSAAWLWGAALLLIGGIGYLAYRKKDALMKFFKKQPTQ